VLTCIVYIVYKIFRARVTDPSKRESERLEWEEEEEKIPSR
jgi:hypothetical protein